ncbi:hypothetical protein GCM10027029_23630 [Conyzicola lurida]
MIVKSIAPIGNHGRDAPFVKEILQRIDQNWDQIATLRASVELIAPKPIRDAVGALAEAANSDADKDTHARLNEANRNVRIATNTLSRAIRKHLSVSEI